MGEEGQGAKVTGGQGERERHPEAEITQVLLNFLLMTGKFDSGR